MKYAPLTLIFAFIFTTATLRAQHFDHARWDAILRAHVSEQGQVDYKAIKANETDLTSYLNAFKTTQPNADWTKNETLAYWINAYNAFTIKLIIDNYPIKSIKDIHQPWDEKFIQIGGEFLSLNHIEHNILRKMNEPRIHFAIVCASYSCPKLLNDAFTASHLETQLTKATRDFLANSERNNLSESNIELSKIFKWFAKDFTENGTLIYFLNQYSEITISANAKKSFKDYNWNLNE